MATPKNLPYRAIVIGCSAGGVEALNQIFEKLPPHYLLPIISIIHLSSKFEFIELGFRAPVGVRVKEAEEKESITRGNIYFAPPNYHLLIEDDETFSLSVEKPVNFARPSIDVTLAAAAEVFQKKMVGILLTGANEDGAQGLKKVQEMGGFTIVQNPITAKAKAMPEAAIRLMKPDQVLTLDEIANFLITLNQDLPAEVFG